MRQTKAFPYRLTLPPPESLFPKPNKARQFFIEVRRDAVVVSDPKTYFLGALPPAKILLLLIGRAIYCHAARKDV